MSDTYMPEACLEPASPYRDLSPAARRAGLELIGRVDALRSTYSGSFTTALRLEAAEDQLAQIEALARRARQALRRAR